MTLDEAREYAKTMTYRDAVFNLMKARAIPYRKATFIKIKELLDIIESNALEQEPCEDDKQKLIKDCQPPTDDWERYADRLHDIAYKNGYEQAQKDLACEDCISRQAAIDALSKGEGCGNVCSRAIKNLPSVSPARPKGKWNKAGTGGAAYNPYYLYKCSNCGNLKEEPISNFCPKCGADMKQSEVKNESISSL